MPYTRFDNNSSIISYRYIELPFWKGSFSKIDFKIFAPIATLTLSATILLNHYSAHNPANEENLRLAMAQSKSPAPEIYKMGCDRWYQDAKLTPCIFNPPTGEPLKTAVLFGDSIGVQWFSAIKKIYHDKGWNLVLLTKSACPIVDEDIFYPRIGKTYEVCTQWRENATKLITNLNPEHVIIGSAATYDLSVKQWKEGTKRILLRISPYSGKIFLIAGTPSLPFNGPSCLKESSSAPSIKCSASGRVDIVKPVEDILREVSSNMNDVQLISLNDIVCPDGICKALTSKGDVMVYRDNQHLHDSYVRSISAFLKSKLF